MNPCVAPSALLVGHHDIPNYNGVGFQRSRSNGRAGGASTDNNNKNIHHHHHHYNTTTTTSTTSMGMNLRSRSTGRERAGGGSSAGKRYTNDRLLKKETLLYNNRTSRGTSNDPNNRNVRETQEFMEWKEQQQQQQQQHHQAQQFSRSRSTGRIRPTIDTKSANDYHQSRLLSSFGSRRSKTPTSRGRVEPKTPTAAMTPSRIRQRSITPSKRRGGARMMASSPSSPSPDARVMLSNSRSATPTSFAERIKMALSPARQRPTNSDSSSVEVDVTTLAMPTVDITSRYQNGGVARSVERPIFESSRLTTPRITTDETNNVFNPNARTTATLFEHTKKKVEQERSRGAADKGAYAPKRPTHEDDQETDDWRPRTKPTPQTPQQQLQSKGSRLAPTVAGSMDPVQHFRNEFKEEDRVEPITSLELQTQDLPDIVSDLSASTIGIGGTIKSPRSATRNTPTPRASGGRSAFNDTNVQKTAPKTPRGGPSGLKTLAIDFHDTNLDGMPKVKSNGYTGPASPMSATDDGDRYTMLSDNNDDFDEAARRRLNSNVPRNSATFGDGVLRNSRGRGGGHAAAYASSSSRSPANNMAMQAPSSSSRGRNTPTPSASSSKSPNSEAIIREFKQRSRSRSKTPKRDKRAATPPAINNNNNNNHINGNGVTSGSNAGVNPAVSYESRGRTGRLLPKRRPTPGLALGQSRSFVDQVEDKLTALKNKREGQQSSSAFRNSSNNNSSSYHFPIRPRGPGAGQSGVADYGNNNNQGRTGKNSTVKKLKKAGAAFVGALTGGRDKPTAFSSSNGMEMANSTNAASGVMMDMVTLRGNKTKNNNDDNGLTLQQQHVASNGAFEMHNNRDSVSSGRSGGTGSRSGKVSLLFGRRRQTKHEPNKTKGGAQSPPPPQDEKSIESTLPVVSRVTTFDSAVKPSNREETKTPIPEFAIVELGEDEDTIQIDSILMNKNDVEVQLTSAQDLVTDAQENTPSAANSHHRRTLDGQTTKLSNEHSPSYATTPTKSKQPLDDSTIDELELTVSFAQQLQQLKELQKPPYKVPRRAYLLR